MRIGFIGAGRMGRPMVNRLVEAGHDVVVLGRTAEKRAAIAQLGASTVAHTAEVSAQADAVTVCLFTDEQVQQVCLADDLLATMPRGSALVVHTTGSPRTVETIAVRAAPRAVAARAARRLGSRERRACDHGDADGRQGDGCVYVYRSGPSGLVVNPSQAHGPGSAGFDGFVSVYLGSSAATVSPGTVLAGPAAAWFGASLAAVWPRGSGRRWPRG